MLSTKPLSETTLKFWRYVFKADIPLFTQYLFKYFGYYRENTNWYIVLFLVSATFFENWRNIGWFQRRKKLWWFSCFIREYVKIFGKKNGVLCQNIDRNVRVLGSLFMFKFHNLIKNIFSIMLKLKYLFGKAWLIVVILG